VLDRPVTLREYPDVNARAVRTLPEDYHTLPVWDNETHFGPLVVVESTGNWHRVITPRDETGWVRKCDVASTLRFFEWALSSAGPASFKFDDWPSEVIESACVFMSPEELVRAADLLKRAREAIPEEYREKDWSEFLFLVIDREYSVERMKRYERSYRAWVRSADPLVRESVRLQAEKSKAANEFKRMFEE